MRSLYDRNLQNLEFGSMLENGQRFHCRTLPSGGRLGKEALRWYDRSLTTLRASQTPDNPFQPEVYVDSLADERNAFARRVAEAE